MGQDTLPTSSQCKKYQALPQVLEQVFTLSLTF